MERLEYESIYGYCRVSSDEQAKHGTSLGEQKKTITKMSLYLFDKEPDGFYVDDGVSGTLDFDNRPNGKELKRNLEPNDVVLVAKLDRLIRRLSVLCNIRDDFSEVNIHLFAHDILGGAESITTSKSPNVNMFVNMMGTFADTKPKVGKHHGAVLVNKLSLYTKQKYHLGKFQELHCESLKIEPVYDIFDLWKTRTALTLMKLARLSLYQFMKERLSWTCCQTT